MKKWVSLLLSVFLVFATTGTAAFAANEKEANGLKTLEYRINEGEWQTVPGFIENSRENSFSVELPRNTETRNAIVEIRATPIDSENKEVFYDGRKTITIADGFVQGSQSPAVFIRDKDKADETGTGIMTVVSFTVAPIDPAIVEFANKNLSIVFDGERSGTQTYNREVDIKFMQNESVTLTVNNTGSDNEPPKAGDSRWKFLGFVIDGEVIMPWDADCMSWTFQTDHLNVGTHDIVMRFVLETYQEVIPDGPVSADTPAAFAWMEYLAEDGGYTFTYNISETFTIEKLTEEPAEPDNTDNPPTGVDDIVAVVLLILLSGTGICVLLIHKRSRA